MKINIIHKAFAVIVMVFTILVSSCGAPETVVPVAPVNRRTAWLELPEKNQDSGLEYYFHRFEMNGKTYRNYTFGWSQQDYVSLWVAYPLCKMYTSGSVGRTDAWNYDPLLGNEKSSAPFGGYGGFTYDRGHQIPSADRQCIRQANVQTYYGTNITPQISGHNEGIWASLEGSVRSWANTSDTTYVITGCVVKGSTKKVEDSDGNMMTVPVAYWKALLRYHEKSTISKWSAAAFYTEHRLYSGTSIKELSMSVDQLEEILGMDLFVNLPAKLGEAKAAEIERQDPKTSQIWW